MEEVSEQTMEKSISSGKTFRGALAIHSSDDITFRKWVSELVGELLDRLKIDYDKNRRLPSLLVVSIKVKDIHSYASFLMSPLRIAFSSFFTTRILDLASKS